MTYRLVSKNKNSYKIGVKQYSQEDALKRQAELSKLGIHVEVMTENEAFGI